MITPEELKVLLKKYRWTIAISKSGRQQVYAAKRRQGKKLATCYIGTSNKLQCLTEGDVVEKINRRARRLVQQRGSTDQAPTDQDNPEEGYWPALPIIPAVLCNFQAGG